MSKLNLNTSEQTAIVPLEQPRTAVHTRRLEAQANELRYDSSDATVIAMAQGYDLNTHRHFVGSLRKSGFNGTIMLATEPQLKDGVEGYLLSKNVTILRLNYTECVHKILQDHEIKNKKDKECNTCIAPYQDVKIRWGRFPFLRDALRNCKACTGPVLVTDVRDTLFQRDPFGDGAPAVNGLQLYAEHRTVVASHPFIRHPIQQCKGIMLQGKMICSGTTIGTREAMLGYLDIMYEEMREWMKDENCWSKKAGGDQAIHNYLYHTGRFDALLPTVYDPREGIVNTVGAKGTALSKMHREIYRDVENGNKKPFPFANPKSGKWLSLEYDLTDKNGYFIDYNGERSRVIHQYDRFGDHFDPWLRSNEGIVWD